MRGHARVCTGKYPQTREGNGIQPQGCGIDIGGRAGVVMGHNTVARPNLEVQHRGSAGHSRVVGPMKAA